MKKITFFYKHVINRCLVNKAKLLLTLLFALIVASTNAQTFTWETATTISTSGVITTVSETVSGVTCQFRAVNTSSGFNINTPVIWGVFNQGTTGNAVSHTDSDAVAVLSFSSPINIQTIDIFDGNYTLTPSGSNVQGTAVTVNANATASTFNFNWSNVEDVLITDATGNANNTIGIDDITFSLPVCTVNIPDANFKNALLANTTLNSNGNMEIECGEASAYSGSINVNNENISDLTGVEFLVNITSLQANDNNLTTIDISSNTALTAIGLSNNSISTVDVTNNLNLKEIGINNNNLSGIDTSNLLDLEIVILRTNMITSIDLLQNTNLEILNLDNNPLASIDLSNNIVLEEVYLNDTGLSSINLLPLTELRAFRATQNQFTAIDFSNNTALEDLWLFDNSLLSIDLTNNSQLTQVFLGDNNLSSVNVANGNNTAINIFRTDNGNTNLSCIQIDAGFTIPSSGWIANAGVTYSDNCPPACIVNIPDTNFKSYLVANSFINTNGDLEIQCDEASVFIGGIIANNLGITDLTGIEAFTSLTRIYASDNNLPNVDLSSNVALQILELRNSNVSSINLSNNTNLVELNLTNNNLNSLSLNTNTLLEDLRCSFNSLTNLDVSLNTQLTFIDLGNNDITSFSIVNNPSLTDLTIQFNQLVTLNLANGFNTNLGVMLANMNPTLSCVQIDSGFTPPTNGFWSIDTTASYSDNCPPCIVNIPDANFKNVLLANTVLNSNGNMEIECSEASSYTGDINVGNQGIVDLTGVEAFTAATTIDFSNNNVVSADFSFTNSFTTIFAFNTTTLISIDISGSTNLDTLSIGQCNVSTLDTSNNPLLRALVLTLNNVSVLDLSTNPNLEFLLLSSNSISTLDLTTNTALKSVNVNSNSMTSLDIANSNNGTITSFNAGNNPMLTCINIDNGFTPPASWSIDTTAAYSDNCATLSINNFKIENFKIYPNPVSGVLNIDSNTTIKTIEIYTVTGKQIKVYKDANSINVSSLNSGMYFIKVSSEDGKASILKFLKK